MILSDFALPCGNLLGDLAFALQECVHAIEQRLCLLVFLTERKGIDAENGRAPALPHGALAAPVEQGECLIDLGG